MIIDGSKVFICAEIGQNHNGDAYTAQRMMTMAQRCGVDGIKLQFRDPEYEGIAPSTLPMPLDAEYISEHSFGRTYGEHRAVVDLALEDLLHLRDRHKYNECKPILFVTPCSPRCVRELERFDYCPIYKIASKDLCNMELIEAVADTSKQAIISTGAPETSLSEIMAAVDALYDNGVVVCHSVSEYPTPLNHVNLRRLSSLCRCFENDPRILLGMSDHTTGIRTSIAAVAMGAKYIEKHVTLSRAMKGRDHAASLEEPGLRQLVEWTRDIERAW
jgi:sialic acid synthase